MFYVVQMLLACSLVYICVLWGQWLVNGECPASHVVQHLGPTLSMVGILERLAWLEMEKCDQAGRWALCCGCGPGAVAPAHPLKFPADAHRIPLCPPPLGCPSEQIKPNHQQKEQRGQATRV